MSMLKPLDPSDGSSDESNITLGRNFRNGSPEMMSAWNKMRVQYKPELGGITLNSHGYLDSSLTGMQTRVMQLLSQSSLSDIERQAIFSAVKLQNQYSPVSPLTFLDSMGMSDSSFHSAYTSGPYYQQTQNHALINSQGTLYSPATLAEILVSNGGRYPGMPILQNVSSLEKSISTDNLTESNLPFYPSYQSSSDQQGSVIINENSECMRQKLQELERELFSDYEEASVVSLSQSTNFDREWADTIENLLFEDSPVHSPTESTNLRVYSDSTLDYPTVRAFPPQAGSEEHSSFLYQTSSSNQEIYTSTIQQEMDLDEGIPCKQLLIRCASAISEGKLELANNIITRLREMVSIHGDPTERIAAYMVEGLAARIASSGNGLYHALKCKEPPDADNLSAMQILFEVCPCFKFGFMAANGAISEVFREDQKVHILDFDIGQGSQYMNLLEIFAKRPGGPPHVRITGVDDPETVKRPIGGLTMIGKRLEQLALSYRVPFQFVAIAEKIGDVEPQRLDIRPEEALAVNFAFQLHHMPDESVSTRNPRDRLLRMVKSLNPKVVTVVEQEVNTNTAPFLPRFVEALNYYSAVFESLDATLPRESRDRLNVEKQCLARDIVNIVACEGADRIERYELAGKWRARLMMAGFTAYPLSASVNNTIKSQLQSYCNSYNLKEEGGALYLGWLDRILIAASAWH
ncbi:hypothetical protein SUGI_1198010 [Cryptomeria japonica]|uniref:scarecrow-like protein 21 n=1 Tax=Cryptomeria japonica TaxID=3369 RepID=UPI0024147A30|nr:scarecrow-like protein 21 [Cryptomeria japonica]XP_057862266.2 scarecrow-like protein 21 [Cryptomeria japonica]XP_057862267.2 scarecrow-like protein 21 [Cryptomeria japonica]GLJ55792.1 hypothetical protein SUGI_1198010 [Cryptomeria japonica]